MIWLASFIQMRKRRYEIKQKGGRRVKKVEQIRNTFETVPDAPVSRFTLTMPGGSRGLIVNSAGLCKHKQRFAATFTGQNGKVVTMHPLLQVPCKRKQR